MIRPRWRKVLSDLWDNKGRTFLVIISIAVGVFSVGMIAGAYGIISEDMSSSYAASKPANIELRTAPFDEDFVETVRRLPGVKDAEGRGILNVRLRTGADEWTGLDLVALPDVDNNINLLLPLDGASRPADREVIIERNVMKKIDADIGDLLEFRLPDGTVKYMPFVGVVQDQTIGAGNYLATPTGFITFDTLEWLRQPREFKRLLVTVSEKPNNLSYIQKVSSEITDKLEQSGREVYWSQLLKSDEHPMASSVQAILGVLGLLGVLIVFLSSSLIANTLSALVNQHMRVIGVMKLIGARSSQIFGMYMALILAFGLIALMIAIPLGGRAAYAISKMIADQMNFVLKDYRLIPMAVVLQTGIALAVPLIAGFIPVIIGSRITVQKAISGYGLGGGQTDSSGVNRVVEKIRWVSRPLLISIRNTFRRKGRLSLTLFTLTLGGAIFIAVFNVQASLERYVEQVGKYFLADVNLRFDRAYRIDEIAQYALEVPGVQGVEGWAFASGEILRTDGLGGDNLQILAPPADSDLVEPMLRQGRWILPGDENAIAVNEAIWDHYPGLRPGDSLRLKINNREADWIVVGIFKFVGMDQILAYANYDYVSVLLNQPNLAFTYRIITIEHTLEYQEQMSARLDSHFRSLGFRVNNADAGLSTMETASEALDVLVAFLFIMAMLTALVGSIGLMGTMGMNVLERTVEIGIMRAIGAVDRVIMRSVIVEGLIIGLISYFLGALLSFPITTMLSDIISQAVFNTPMGFIFRIQGFLIWIIFVLILSALASVVPALNAARLTIREVLAYE